MISFLLLFLSLFGIHDLRSLEQFIGVIPVIGLTVAAYVFGLSARLLMQWLIQRILPKHRYNAKQDVAFLSSAPAQLKDRARFSFGTHVLFQLLTAGTFVLAICLVIWLCVIDSRQFILPALIGCLLLTLFFGLVYCSHRPIYIELRDAIQAYLDSRNN